MSEYTFASTATVLGALDGFATSSTQLHEGFCNLIAECRQADSKLDIVKSGDLTAIFAHPMPGVDRKRLLSWVVEYTPIRPKFKKNGQFEKIGFARKAGAEAWDIDGAMANPWYKFEQTKTTKARAANVRNALEQLALAIAKEGVESSLRGQGSLLASLDAARNLVNSYEFNSMMQLAMSGEKFTAWVEERTQIIEEEKRNAPKQNETVLAEIARLAA